MLAGQWTSVFSSAFVFSGLLSLLVRLAPGKYGAVG